MKIKKIDDNQVWDLMELLPGRKAVGGKWVHKCKTGADGSVNQDWSFRGTCKSTELTSYDETFIYNEVGDFASVDGTVCYELHQ